MSDLPSLFLSHGAPTLALEDCPARRFLLELGAKLQRPRSILAISAHWESSSGTAVSTAIAPETIHDFGGFPRDLYEIKYPAPGAAGYAEEAARLLEGAGFAVARSANRGLDHGAWVPLGLMYPQADIPVAQIALMRGGSPRDHYQLGAALRPLRAQGVLIVGSGSITHNLAAFAGNRLDAAPPQWVSAFADWIAAHLAAGDLEALFDYRRLAPGAATNHPTEEHLLPLFVSIGAAADGDELHAERIHASYAYAILAMDAYAFSGAAAAPELRLP
jgi:4,5-DOPA dioxygenase extradiol